MIVVESAYFDPQDICESGQMFRYLREGEETLLFSKNDGAKIVKFEGKYAIISSNDPYFRRYFDLETDYGALRSRLHGGEIEDALAFGRGMRILRQDPFETTICFLISQNNHIPRIKSVVSRICERLGERRAFEGREYHSFPTPEEMARAGAGFYREIGAGYRAEYLQGTAEMAAETDFAQLEKLPDEKLREELRRFPGVGPKVGDCILLFGFGRTKSFPVDTWIEKVYHTRFGGTQTDRRKMTKYFEEKFGEASGYVQQLLFYHARSLGRKNLNWGNRL